MGTNLKPQVILKMEQLEPHPDNPRKDLGDLTELTESIRENGVLQNLTVVPLDEGWKRYRIIIGHRRFAAAREAGLTELYCTVAEGLDDKEQMATMLAENMQRADLTVCEQAEGIQMMFDMGVSAGQISEMTGLSKSTVYSRKKIASIGDEAKKAEQSGATLMDLDKIAEIKSDKVREKLLGYVGTNNFDYYAAQAKSKQDRDERTEQAIAYSSDKLEKISKKESNLHDVEQIMSGPKKEELSDWIDRAIEEYGGEIKYRIEKNKDYANTLYLYHLGKKQNSEGEEKELSPEEIERKKAEEERVQRVKRIEAAWELGVANREKYFNGMGEAKAKELVNKAITKLLTRRAVLLWKDDFEKYFNPQGAEDYKKWIAEHPEKAMVILAYSITELGHNGAPVGYRGDVLDYKVEEAMKLMELVQEFGYEPSTMELSLADGTNELYLKPVEEETENA